MRPIHLVIAASLAAAACVPSDSKLDEGGLFIPAACAGRSPGALVMFDIAGERLQLWITNQAFLEEARWRVSTGAPHGVAVFRLVDGEDCDANHDWHVEPDTATFADAAIEVCDGRPSDVDSDKTYWLETLQGQYCPWMTRVVAVLSPSGT